MPLQLNPLDFVSAKINWYEWDRRQLYGMSIEARFDTCSRDALETEARHACTCKENERDAQRDSIL